MRNVNDSVWLVVLGLTLLFLQRRRLRKAATAFVESFKEEMDNFPRGGPPTPMHPSPAGDDLLLRRRSSKNSKRAY